MKPFVRFSKLAPIFPEPQSLDVRTFLWKLWKWKRMTPRPRNGRIYST